MDRYERNPDRRRGDRRDDRGWRETERDTGRGRRPGEGRAYRPDASAGGDDRYGRYGFEDDYQRDRDVSRHYAGEAGPGHGRDTYDRVRDSREGYRGEAGRGGWDGPPRGPRDEERYKSRGRPWDEMQRFEREPREQMEPDWEVDRYDRATLHGNADRDRFGGRSERGRSFAPRDLDDDHAESRGEWGRGFDEQRRRASFRGHGPKGYRRSDDRIREDVCDALTEDPDLDARDCTVKVENGEVTLEGRVDSRRLKHLAENLACACSGVVDVENRLRVRPRDEHAESEDGEDRSNGRHYQGAGSQNARSR